MRIFVYICKMLYLFWYRIDIARLITYEMPQYTCCSFVNGIEVWHNIFLIMMQQKANTITSMIYNI